MKTRTLSQRERMRYQQENTRQIEENRSFYDYLGFVPEISPEREIEIQTAVAYAIDNLEQIESEPESLTAEEWVLLSKGGIVSRHESLGGAGNKLTDIYKFTGAEYVKTIADLRS